MGLTIFIHFTAFLTLSQWLFVFLNAVGFDAKLLSMNFSSALLSPSDSYYLSFRIHTNVGAVVFVSYSTASENQRFKWK